MTRSLLLGLAWLALLVAPFSEAVAQTPTSPPTPWQAEPRADEAAQRNSPDADDARASAADPQNEPADRTRSMRLPTCRDLGADRAG